MTRPQVERSMEILYLFFLSLRAKQTVLFSTVKQADLFSFPPPPLRTPAKATDESRTRTAIGVLLDS